MPGVAADLVDVRGAEDLLDADDPLGRRLLLAQEVRHERLHAGAREEDRRIVLQDGGRARQAVMALLLEEGDEPLAYGRAVYRRLLSGAGGRSPPTLAPRRAKRKRGSPSSAPRVPLVVKSLASGPRGAASAVARCCGLPAALVPLPFRLVDELATLHGRVVGELLRDLLQVVGTALQLFAARLELLPGEIPGLRRVEEREHGAREQPNKETHLSFTPWPRGLCPFAPRFVGFAPRPYRFAGASATATASDASAAAAPASKSCVSPSRPAVQPASSPRACAQATAATASTQACASAPGRPASARTAAGTPIATSPRVTTAGGTQAPRLGEAKSVSAPSEPARSGTTSPSGIRATAARAKSGSRKK